MLVRAGNLFFFQAEDGIRDKLVTGVQTWALPIYRRQEAGKRPRLGGLQPRRPPRDRTRCGGMGGPRRAVGSGGDTADLDGQRWGAGRLRAGPPGRGQLGGAPAGDRVGWSRHRRPQVRRAHQGRGGGGTGGHDLPLPRTFDRRREGRTGGAWAGDQAMKPDFSKGLVPAVVQDAATGKVLMLAYMDEEAWTKTRDTGKAWFH